MLLVARYKGWNSKILTFAMGLFAKVTSTGNRELFVEKFSSLDGAKILDPPLTLSFQ